MAAIYTRQSARQVSGSGSDTSSVFRQKLTPAYQRVRHSEAARRRFERELGAPAAGWRVSWNENREPVIRGRRGELYPYGEKLIGVYVAASARVVTGVERRHADWLVMAGGASPGDPLAEIVLIAPARDLAVAAREVRAFRRRCAPRTAFKRTTTPRSTTRFEPQTSVRAGNAIPNASRVLIAAETTANHLGKRAAS